MSQPAYQSLHDMFISIDGHQIHRQQSCLVGGDAPHTLAFIVSSVFKVLPTNCTQTLQSEANFASKSVGAESKPARLHFPKSQWLIVSAVNHADCVIPVLGE